MVGCHKLQGAYGILVDVESHPFALDTMLFMDWRDDYAASDPQMQAANRCASRPPFLVSSDVCRRLTPTFPAKPSQAVQLHALSL